MFVNVSANAWLLPTLTVPKFKLVGLAPRAPGASPVPVRGKDSDGFGASEVIVTVPLAAPVTVGANLTVNVVVFEALIASGVVMPLKVNPVPLTAA